MKKIVNQFVLLFVLILFLNNVIIMAQPKDRSEIEVKDTWRLEDIYTTENDWKTAKEAYAKDIEKLPEFKGTLTISAKKLLAFLEYSAKLSKEGTRLYSYASMHSDEDTRKTEYLAMKQEMDQLFTKAGSMSSYSVPEILTLNKATIDRFISEEEGLKPYKVYLYDLLRKKEHKLSEKEEKILAEANLLTGTPYSIYNVFSNAEMPYPEVTLSTGEKVRLDQAGYSKYRGLQNREDRELVFKTFWETYSQYQRTIAEQLYGNVKVDVFNMKARGYKSSLESALDGFNIPTEVYTSLVNNVNNNLGSFHRYLELKKRMLGVDTLKYSDMYAPTVEGVELEYDIEEAKEMVLDAVKPLGKEYQAILKESFDERWIDVYPTPGKRSGAYSNGSVYDVHPYVLLNYNGEYEDVSTLAHEMGHALHSYNSNKNQPFATADYSIFVAEVASTFNEVLLYDKVLKEIKDEDTRLSLLMTYLDGFKGTLFRQTQFAEFELKIHEKVEAGEPLTSDVLSKMYGDILEAYYGQDKNVCIIDDLYKMEWAYIPHFYYNFYVYQYATSFTASIALAEKVQSGEEGAVDKYLNFISSGSSDYPINLLKNAGVDMTTQDPFNNAMKVMNRIMDEIEKILDKKGI